MEKLNFQMIKDIIQSDIFEENDRGPSNWMERDVYSVDDTDDTELRELFEKLGKFELVKYSGGEGYGDDYWSVYHFEDHGVYIQFDGSYSSYSGTEYYDMFEVRPEEVTRIEYVRV